MNIVFKLVLIFSILFLGNISELNAQNNKFKNKYKSYIPKDEKRIKNGYHFVVTKKEKSFIRRYFYPERNQITSLITYADSKFKKKEGTFIKWFDNGSKRFEGSYHNNKREGNWKNYYYGENILSSEGHYKEGEINGTWKNYDKKGRITIQLEWKNGLKDGEFIRYDSLKNITNKGIYKSDTIFFQEKEIIKSPVNIKYAFMSSCKEITDEKERKKCSNTAIINYIYKNITYPEDARFFGIEGTALFRFVVNKKGELTKIQSLNALCESIEKECLRLLNRFPDWSPGEKDGEKIKISHTLPIKFKLE